MFVPGGRVMKGETLTAALRRVIVQETGLTIEPEQFVLQGIYDHTYSDSCFDDPDLSTQYVVIACRCSVRSEAVIVADDQHETLHFTPIANILANPQIHPYVKNYFREHAENRFLDNVNIASFHSGSRVDPVAPRPATT
jgi:colanic acid biosynthesis protein WcaH